MAYKFNPDSKPTENVIVGWYRDNVIMSSQNIIQIIGSQKSGKSLVSSDILIGTLSGGKTDLGFDFTKVPDDKYVYYYDTEMSEGEFYNRMKKVVELSGNSRNLQAYNLINEEVQERISFVSQATNAHIVIIDGVIDMCRNFNNEEASMHTIGILKSMAARNNCPVVVILHTNPKEKFNMETKSKGHLGTLLQNKVQSTIMLQKLSGDIFKMGFKDLRNSGEIKERAYFEYDHNMIYIPSDKTVNKSTQEVIIDALKKHDTLTSKELYNETKKYKNVTWPTIVRAANNLSQVTKQDNKYQLCS